MTARRPQGFATLTPERRAEIASTGGKRAQEMGVAHRWTPDEARKAGRLGGSARHANARKRKTATA